MGDEQRVERRARRGDACVESCVAAEGAAPLRTKEAGEGRKSGQEGGGRHPGQVAEVPHQVRLIEVAALGSMCILRPRVVVLALAAALVAPGARRPLQAQAPSDLPRLAFLAGCWELRTATRVTQEQWMAPLGGLMVGMSRTVVRDAAREWEALHIVARDSVVTYVAQPGGRPPTYFPATTIGEGSVTFAYPQHDFPQRLSYRRVGADSLIARIEGDRNGQTRGMDIPMRKVPCG